MKNVNQIHGASRVTRSVEGRTGWSGLAFGNACTFSVFPPFAGPGDQHEFLLKGNLELLPGFQLSTDTSEHAHELDDPC